MKTEQFLCWSGMTDTEDTSGLNEEFQQDLKIFSYSAWRLAKRLKRRSSKRFFLLRPLEWYSGCLYF